MEITRGFAFRGLVPARSDKPHICLILNKKVEKGDDILCVYFTSKGDKARQRLRNDPVALIEVNPREYDAISDPSYLQCSRAYIQHIGYDDFIASIGNGTFDCSVPRANERLIAKIIQGISLSKTFSVQDLKAFG